jgi:hypothetical protein
LLPEWIELILGIPAILLVFGAVLWYKGFGPEDRELFRMSKAISRRSRIPASWFQPGSVEIILFARTGLSAGSGASR